MGWGGTRPIWRMLAIGGLCGALLYHGAWRSLVALLCLMGGYAFVREKWPIRKEIGRQPRIVPYRYHLLVCQGRACRGRGADWLQVAIKAAVVGRAVRVTPTRCQELCARAPVARLEPAGMVWGPVKWEDIVQLSGDGDHRAY